MAVARMQKVNVFFHNSLKEEVLEEIQRAGILHVGCMEESYPELPEGVSFQKESGVGEQETLLSGLEFALEYLKPFEEKRGLLNKLGTARVELDEQEYRKLVAEFTGQEVVRSCRKLERDRVRLNAEFNEKNALKQQMSDRVNLDIPFEDLSPTATSEVILGSVPGGQFDVLSQRLAAEDEVFHLELVGKSGLEEHCLLLYHRRESDAVARILEELEFTEKRFPNLQGTPKQVIGRLDREMASLRKSLNRLDEESRKLVPQRPKLMVLAEHTADELEKRRAELKMVNTERVFLLEGWVKKKNFRKLEDDLKKKFAAISIVPTDTLPGEMPPVELENKPLPSSFEMVIDLYGRPKYTEIDPTPILTPFFAIFFGLCLTDAGYGLTLCALSLFFLRKFRLGRGTRKLFQLLLWSGLATIVAGALTGGYFGIDWSKFSPESPVVKAVYAVKMFDPIADALTFFQVAIVCGVVHIFAGLSLKMFAGIREGDALRSILMHGPWLLADVGLGIFMMNFLSPVGEILSVWAKYLLVAGMLGIFLFSGIGSKNPIVWVGKGLGGLYGVIGIFSDILSYSRLVALGLATAVIAGVINILGIMLVKIPYVGIIMAIILFVVAHLGYLLICCLGAFVHTARLNFVEFFSKFYEGGGEQFNPLSKRAKFVLWNERKEEVS